MATEIELDIDALLAPFGGDAPAGTDPREDASAQSFYYRLRDARAEARDAERKSDGDVGETGGTPQQWRTVRDLSLRVLRERAKDLEIAAWLTEALVRDAGFAGLTAGAKLIRGLALEFWDSGLFPLPDEDGLATLVAPVSGLNGVTAEGTLAQALRKQIMFRRGDGSEVTFWQYAQSVEVEGIGDAPRKKARLAAGVPVFSALDGEARGAGGPHWAALRDELDATLLAWKTMSGVLDEKAGGDAPSTGRVSDLLGSLLSSVERYAPARVAAATAEEEQAEEQAAPQPGGDQGAAPVAALAARQVNRDDMLAQLGKIADFFRKFEPQSPLSLTLDEAVRRARLSWAELLEEVLADQSSRNNIMVQLGIRPKKPEEAAK